MNKIKAARTSRGLTQWRAAQLVGVGEVYWSKIETGRRKPSIALLRRIAAALAIPEKSLM